MATTERAGNFKNLNAGNIDAWRGPYPDKAAACLAIPNILDGDGKNLRAGKFVDIGLYPNVIAYCWQGGFGDSNLVEYLAGLVKEETIKPVLDELVGSEDKAGAPDALTSYAVNSVTSFAATLNNGSVQNIGQLTGFTLRCNTAGDIYLAVWRPDTGNNYTLIYKKLVTAGVGVNNFPIVSGPELLKGDKIGYINVVGGAAIYRKVKVGAGLVSRTLTWSTGSVVDMSEVNDYEWAISASVLKDALRNATNANTLKIRTLEQISLNKAEFAPIKEAVVGGLLPVGVTDDFSTYTSTSGTTYAPIINSTTVSKDGKLESVALKCNVAGDIFAAVWRLESGNNYKLIVKIPLVAVVGTETYAVPPGLIREVKAGDRFGYINVVGGAQVYRKVKTSGSQLSRVLTPSVGDILDFSEVHGYEFAIKGFVREYALDVRINQNKTDVQALSVRQDSFQSTVDDVKGGVFNTGTSDALTTYTSVGTAAFAMLQNVNPVSKNGYIQSISLRLATAGDIYLAIWRPLGGTDYKLIHKILFTGAIGLNTFTPAATQYEVKSGDKVGFINIIGGPQVYRKVKVNANNVSRILTIAVGENASMAELHTYEFAINAVIKEKSLKEKVSSLESNPSSGDAIPDFETAYALMTQNKNTGFVGGQIWRKKRNGLTDLLNEANKHEYYHTDYKAIRNKLINVKWVDCKGTGDYNNPGRILTHITEDGWMIFKNNYLEFQKIKVDDFLAALVQHDGSNTDAQRLDWADMPADASSSDKTARYNKEILNWRMLNTSAVTFTAIPKPGAQPAAMTTLEFANGTLINNQYIYRKDGTYAPIKLKNPVVGNPTHLIIKSTGGTVLHEIALEQYGTGLRWGKMLANIGTITYADVIGACINFNNGKSITVPITLGAGIYKFVLRGRRYGTYLVDGTVEVNAGSTSLGSIAMTGNSSAYTYESSAVLLDNEGTFTVAEAISSITLKAVCDTEKEFNPNNFSQGTGRNKWGWTTNGVYGTITEYEPNKKRSGMMYFSSDCGESWQALFDISLSGTARIDDVMTSVNTGGGHIHGACIDLYWNKIWIVAGDADNSKGIYHANLVNGDINVDNVVWVREPFMKPFYGSANGEQYCSVYAMEKTVIFGTDCIPSGIFRMNRINSETLSDREPSCIIHRTALSHIPSIFYRKDESSPAVILTIQGDSPGPRIDRVPFIHATYDGIHIKEIWKDNLIQEGFGYNSFASVFEYKGKVFAQIFSDKRFQFSQSLVIGDWNR